MIGILLRQFWKIRKKSSRERLVLVFEALTNLSKTLQFCRKNLFAFQKYEDWTQLAQNKFAKRRKGLQRDSKHLPMDCLTVVSPHIKIKQNAHICIWPWSQQIIWSTIINFHQNNSNKFAILQAFSELSEHTRKSSQSTRWY